MKSKILLPIITLFTFFYTPTKGLSQLTPDKTEVNLGDISATSNRTADFFIVNHYQFSVIFSSFLIDWDLSTAHTPTTIEPGDTLHYRVKITPPETGPFEKTIPLSFFRLSDTIKLTLKGNALTTDFDDKAPLVQFDAAPGKNDEPFKDFPVKFRVLDIDTKEPIEAATISFSANSPTYKRLATNANGEATRTLHNLYDVTIFAFGYESARFGISLGCNDSVRTVLLPKYDPNKKRPYEYFYEYEANHSIGSEDSLEKMDINEEAELLKPFDEGNYKPNNIVFLMDVSISMKDHNRIELLKSAIIQLVELMRPEDNISLITFSEHTRVLVPPTYLKNTDRSNIIRIIQSLKPSGMTNGGKGLKMAFSLVQRHYSEDKNNQVILATDGALGAYMKHEDIVKLVKKNNSYASTSVVTLNGYNWTGKFMKEITTAGKGKLIPINNEREAKLMLIRDIKRNSIIE